MTRQPHDQFAKQYLKELLEPLGTVEISREIPGETLQIDLMFQPSGEPSSQSSALGLLAELATTPCLLEPYRNCPSDQEIRNCMLKLFHVQAELYRQAKRTKQTVEEQPLPHLWILTPTLSKRLVEDLGATQDSQHNYAGVYSLARITKTGIIAINQLPEVVETLWLRILGKGGTQKRAIEQVLELPPNHPQRRNILELIGIWRINIQNKIQLEPEDTELIMELSPAYLKWREDTLQQGRQEGRQEGLEQGKQQQQRLTVEVFLRTRFGELDEALLGIVDSLSELSLDEFITLGLNSSREELLERFGEGID
ncbi:hypothetical protein [Roseofilum casamattae]|uniref:DUF4351 domain-containing protein n=1 Tax=Roseofilum casamattae BLCC-M143 TaxID=3022442 RepID=A0ABT7BZ25_9CYAN|nr:hypothetical protein [Roseofilum casamattae]MDJ1184452.1 hypothetical protein [Roseofilum casamattae BLCC-M143]